MVAIDLEPAGLIMDCRCVPAKGLVLAAIDWTFDESPELSSLAPAELDEPRTRINEQVARSRVYVALPENRVRHP